MKRFSSDIRFDPNQIEKLNKVILQSDFNERVDEVRKVNLSIVQKPTSADVIIPFITSVDNQLLKAVEEISSYDLNPSNGNSIAKETCFGGYDESKFKFLSLEGEAHITTHAIDYYIEDNNTPICTITFYFYTRSKNIVDKSQFIKFTDDISSQSNLDYALDRSELIANYALDNSILFIDGPLIGGNISHFSVDLVQKLQTKNILPVFIVKNSDSNLVVDNINGLRDEYNSDLHWAYKTLNEGQRTNFFSYVDKHNKNFSKFFCYIKPFNYISPQRIEIHSSTYSLYHDFIPDLLDLIYYLLLLHGDKKNPQIRPIAIAEKYAREVLRTINVELLLRRSSLTQTMNELRFGG